MYCDSLKGSQHVADLKVNLGFQTPSTLANIMLPSLESSLECPTMYINTLCASLCL